MDTPAQMSPPVAECDPPGGTGQPDQVDLNKKEKPEENAKDVPLKVEKKKCFHPESEIIRPCNGITICTACYDLIE
jgi:hypothetical protein